MIIKVFNNINLDKNSFREVNLKDFNDFYLIGITNNKEIKSITFEVAIDSGVKNKPLLLPNIKLDFEKDVSATRVLNYPNEFYIRPIQLINKDSEVIKTGTFNVEVNINALNLG